MIGNKLEQTTIVVAMVAICLMGCTGFKAADVSSEVDIDNTALRTKLFSEEPVLANSVGGYLFANDSVQMATSNECGGTPTRPAFSPSLAMADGVELVLDDGASVVHKETLNKNDLLLRRTIRVPASAFSGDRGQLFMKMRNSQVSGDHYPSLLVNGERLSIQYHRDETGKVRVDSAPSFVVKAANLGETSECPRPSDPLVLFFNSGVNSRIEMTSPSTGVQFDIAGVNAQTNFQSTPYVKKRISWMRTCEGCFFLALPNQNGEVHGIDQLFGDNTRGPDGETANDGFHALSKYDANQDGRIDSQDAVFKQLRLWQDKNMNGAAEASELLKVSDKKVTAISLKYDKYYREVDEHGNEIRFKSLASTDSSPALVFDLWLQMHNIF